MDPECRHTVSAAVFSLCQFLIVYFPFVKRVLVFINLTDSLSFADPMDLQDQLTYEELVRRNVVSAIFHALTDVQG